MVLSAKLQYKTHEPSDLQYFFFRCVQDNQCGGLVDTRGIDDPGNTNLICDDPNHTCCHESVINQCQKHYEIGYRYIHKH